jgi:hypothetical protein
MSMSVAVDLCWCVSSIHLLEDHGWQYKKQLEMDGLPHHGTKHNGWLNRRFAAM